MGAFFSIFSSLLWTGVFIAAAGLFLLIGVMAGVLIYRGIPAFFSWLFGRFSTDNLTTNWLIVGAICAGFLAVGYLLGGKIGIIIVLVFFVFQWWYDND